MLGHELRNPLGAIGSAVRLLDQFKRSQRGDRSRVRRDPAPERAPRATGGRPARRGARGDRQDPPGARSRRSGRGRAAHGRHVHRGGQDPGASRERRDGAGVGLRRQRAVRAGHRQPAHQRAQVHAGRRQHSRDRRARWSPRTPPGGGHGHGHRRRTCSLTSSTCSSRASGASTGRRAGWASGSPWSSGWSSCRTAPSRPPAPALGKAAASPSAWPPSPHRPAKRRRSRPSRPPRRAGSWSSRTTRTPRDMLRQLLENAGHEVHDVGDGPQGVDAALRLEPDVALIDVGLPELDGYEVARRIRAGTRRDMLLVALTGYGLAEDRERALAAGFDLPSGQARRLRQALRRAGHPGPLPRPGSPRLARQRLPERLGRVLGPPPGQVLDLLTARDPRRHDFRRRRRRLHRRGQAPVARARRRRRSARARSRTSPPCRSSPSRPRSPR